MTKMLCLHRAVHTHTRMEVLGKGREIYAQTNPKTL